MEEIIESEPVRILEQEDSLLSPYDSFVYGLRVKETKRQYPHRLDIFMTFIGLRGDIPEKCASLYELAKSNEKSNPNLLQALL